MIFDKRENHPYYLAYTYAALMIFLELVSGEPIHLSILELLRTIYSQSSELMGHKVDPTWRLFGV